MSFTRDSVSKLLLTIGFFLLALNALFIEISFLEGVVQKNILRVTVLLFIVGSIILSQIKIKSNIVILLVFLVLSLLITINIDQVTLVYILLLVQATRVFDERELVARLFFSNAIVFFAIFLFLFLDITHNEVRVFRERSTFGLNGVGGPTLFYNILYGFMIMGCLYFRGVKEKLFIFMSVVMCIYFYLLTDVRGGAAAFLLFVILLYSLPFLLRLKMTHRLFMYVPVFFTGIALVVTFLLNNEYFNTLLSNRPFLYFEFFEKITIADIIFGTSVKNYDLNSIVDNSFIHLLIGGGSVFFVYFLYHFARSMKGLVRLKEYKNIAFVLSSSLYFFIESLAVRIENMFVIYYWVLILFGVNYIRKNIVFKKKKLTSFKNSIYASKALI